MWGNNDEVWIEGVDGSKESGEDGGIVSVV